MLNDAWNQNAKKRHEQITSGLDISYSNVLERTILKVVRRLPSHESFNVLDMGCGTGVLTRSLSDIVNKITGIDPSADSIQIAKAYTVNKKNIALENIAIDDYALHADGIFDLVVANMSLQAIEDLSAAISSISVCLKSQGYFVFSIPHPCFWALYKQESFVTGYKYSISSRHELVFTISKDRNPLPEPVPYFHRSLETYSMSLAENRFVVERMYEPFPDTEVIEENNVAWDVPHFLIGVCKKN